VTASLVHHDESAAINIERTDAFQNKATTARSNSLATLQTLGEERTTRHFLNS
jgi:hypothetical protein